MKTNHYLTLSAVIVAGFISCTSENLVSETSPTGKTNEPTAMSFDVHTQNMTREEIPAGALQNHTKQFGVWTYKTVSDVESTIMDNYLVGYYDATGKTGYYATTTTATTLGDAESTTDGQSMWFYEGLGSSQYSHENDNEAGENYETSSPSVKTEQYLKYWDASSDKYDFYAYIPYNSNATLSAEKKLTFSLYTASATTDGTGENANLVAKTTVEKGSGYTYADVPLTFKRLNGKVRVAFWEDLGPGYKVEITSAVTVTPKDQTTDDYTNGKIAVKGTPVYDFANGKDAWTYENTSTETNYSYSGDSLTFAKPAGTSTTIPSSGSTSYNVIASTKSDALEAASTSISATNYYCVPANTDTDHQNSGLMFKFTFKTIATDSGEETEYKNKEVFVPATNNQWVGNTVYTYIFKITGQKPIVFDGIVISSYDTQNVDTDVNVQ